MKGIKRVATGIVALALSLGFAACGEDKSESKAVEAVIDQINSLPVVTELSLEDGDALAEALAAYDALSAEEKKSVENSDKLAALEARLAVLVRVDNVQKKLDAIPSSADLTYADKEAIDEARIYVRAHPALKLIFDIF